MTMQEYKMWFMYHDTKEEGDTKDAAQTFDMLDALAVDME